MTIQPTEMNIATNLGKRFFARYRVAPRLFRAPGRVNLIGEHTDYNDGFVLPVAIDRSTWVAISPRDDQKLLVHSENVGENTEIDLRDSSPQPRTHWADYVCGVALMLRRSGHPLRGANLLIHGEVPLGSGLSSSASLEVGVGCALLGNSAVSVGNVELAHICQRAENEFVGARCGIMDQFVACSAQAGHALLLDCRSLEYRHLPLMDGASLMICNTMVKHELASGEYNTRRAQCEESVRHLALVRPQIKALRDVSLAELEQQRQRLPEIIYRRSRHVVSENARVIEAVAALEDGDLARFGRLMNDSHLSLRDDYEVSSDELNRMVELAAECEGVYGSRMTGGGFGGCTISLVRSDCVTQFRSDVANGYEQSTGRRPEIYVSRPAAGAGEIML